MVALAGLNEDQLLPMLDHCAKAGCDLTLIETMPLGEIADDRSDHYIPLHQFIAPLREARAIYPVDKPTDEIGRESCRCRVWKGVSISVCAEYLQKQKQIKSRKQKKNKQK